MSRQDANAAFARTSFLYGGNADYIENLYARYETDPTAVDAQWQAFFKSLKDDRQLTAGERSRPASSPNKKDRLRVQAALGSELKSAISTPRPICSSDQRARCYRSGGC